MADAQHMHVTLAGEIFRIEPRPDEVFFLTTKAALSAVQVARIQDEWNRVFPAVRLMVVDSGMTLSCVAPHVED